MGRSGSRIVAPSGNELALVARDADGRYPNRGDVRLLDSGYNQRDIRLEGRYSISGHSLLSGYFGIARRDYPTTSNRDFSGPIGRLSYDWLPTPRFRAGIQARRELGAKEDLTDTYVVTTAAGVNIGWDLTIKIDVRLWGRRGAVTIEAIQALDLPQQQEKRTVSMRTVPALLTGQSSSWRSLSLLNRSREIAVLAAEHSRISTRASKRSILIEEDVHANDSASKWARSLQPLHQNGRLKRRTRCHRIFL